MKVVMWCVQKFLKRFFIIFKKIVVLIEATSLKQFVSVYIFTNLLVFLEITDLLQPKK